MEKAQKWCISHNLWTKQIEVFHLSVDTQKSLGVKKEILIVSAREFDSLQDEEKWFGRDDFLSLQNDLAFFKSFFVVVVDECFDFPFWWRWNDLYWDSFYYYDTWNGNDLFVLSSIDEL